MIVLSYGYNTKTFVGRIEQNDQTIQQHIKQTDATTYSTGIRLSMLTSSTRTVRGLNNEDTRRTITENIQTRTHTPISTVGIHHATTG